MRSFYLAYREKVQTLSALFPLQHITKKAQTASALFRPSLTALTVALPLPWSHYVRLLAVRNIHARSFYEAEALRGGWTIRQLDRQIGSQFYERVALSRNKAAMLQKVAISKPEDGATPEEEIKDPFVLEFLGLRDEYSESAIEEARVSHDPPRRGSYRCRTQQDQATSRGPRADARNWLRSLDGVLPGPGKNRRRM